MDNVFYYTKFKTAYSDFESSVIDRLAYNVHNGEMLVQFKHGTQRLYRDVGPLTFTRFTQADSVGQYYNEVFKGNSDFPSEAVVFDGYQRVDDEEPLADWEKELLHRDGDVPNDNSFPELLHLNAALETSEEVIAKFNESDTTPRQFAVGDTVSGKDDLDALPVGTEIGVDFHNDNLVKQDDGRWKAADAGWIYDSEGLTYERTIISLPSKWTVGQRVSDDDYKNLPVGSVVDGSNEPIGGNLTKVSEGMWKDNLTVYFSTNLFVERELLEVGDGTYDDGTDETELPEIAADGDDLEAAQPLWYNDDSVKLYADGSAQFGEITANSVTIGRISTNHLFDVAFRTEKHNGVIRGGTVPVWAADEAAALVKFQSAMTALGYSTVSVESVKHYF